MKNGEGKFCKKILRKRPQESFLVYTDPGCAPMLMSHLCGARGTQSACVTSRIDRYACDRLGQCTLPLGEHVLSIGQSAAAS